MSSFNKTQAIKAGFAACGPNTTVKQVYDYVQKKYPKLNISRSHVHLVKYEMKKDADKKPKPLPTVLDQTPAPAATTTPPADVVGTGDGSSKLKILEAIENIVTSVGGLEEFERLLGIYKSL